MTYDIPSFWDSASLGIAGAIIFIIAAIAAVIISFHKLRIELWAVAAALTFVSLFSVGISIQFYTHMVTDSTVSQTQSYLAAEYGADFTREETLNLMNYQASGRYQAGALLPAQFDVNSPDYVKNMAYGTTSRVEDGELVHFQLAKTDGKLELFTETPSQIMHEKVV